ncbi:hypothetical protein OAF85_00670 [Planctomycetota bacterium]|nr:hypothetical protein [Planctomycetota bacterium]
MIAGPTIRAAVILALCVPGLGADPGEYAPPSGHLQPAPSLHGPARAGVNSSDEAPEIRALKEAQAPEPLVRAVEEQLHSAGAERREGVAARAIIGFPGEDPGTEVKVVFAFASAWTLKRPDAARRKAALRAKGELVSAAWETPLAPAAFPELFGGFDRQAHLEGLEVNAWDGEDGWSWNLSICPLDQITVEPNAIEAAWLYYRSALVNAAREAAKGENWKACRGYLTERQARGPLDRSAEILTLWLTYSDGARAGDRAPIEQYLRSWPPSLHRSPEMLEMLEFLICTGLKDHALEALQLYRSGSGPGTQPPR